MPVEILERRGGHSSVAAKNDVGLVRNGFRPTQRKRLSQPGSDPLRLSLTGQGRLALKDRQATIRFAEVRGEPRPSDSTPVATNPAEWKPRDALQLYLREVGQVNLLTAQEEIALAKRVRRGDQTAREQMIKANLRLVVKIAREYENLGMPLLDLISEGNIGLITGVERFDPRKGAKLSTYAACWIKQAIKRALANQSRTIRLPVHVVDKLAAIRRTEAEFHDTLGREATDEELADRLEIGDARRVRRYRDAARKPVELDAPLGSDPDSPLVSDTVADSNAAAPFIHLIKENDRNMLWEALAGLNERDRMVIDMRFGLNEKTPKTLEEIGRILGLTRERIRQLQNGALKKLQTVMQKREAVRRECEFSC